MQPEHRTLFTTRLQKDAFDDARARSKTVCHALHIKVAAFICKAFSFVAYVLWLANENKCLLLIFLLRILHKHTAAAQIFSTFYVARSFCFFSAVIFNRAAPCIHRTMSQSVPIFILTKLQCHIIKNKIHVIFH